jgi:hypothetical protein
MRKGRQENRWSLLAGPTPTGFTRSVVRIDVGGSLDCRSPTWWDALVIVTRGAIDVETSDGIRCGFATGAVLAVGDLARSRLHNSGTEVAELTTVRRSRPADPRPVEPAVTESTESPVTGPAGGGAGRPTRPR